MEKKTEREAILARAVKIAAQMMTDNAICKNGNERGCSRVYAPSPTDCDGCIRRFLIAKAKKELDREEKDRNRTPYEKAKRELEREEKDHAR